MNRREVSKQMAYLLRHDPSGISMDEEGFVDLEELLSALQERWTNLTDPELRGIVEEDPKGRYEISGDRIRALYGHSVDVDPDLPEVEVKVLYHGTSPKAAERIDREGLRSQGRRKVHLSARQEDAIEVGKRHTPEPVLLEIEADKAIDSGVPFQKASDKVYVTDYVPPKFIKPIDR
ncbi:RNA 2'-phosphotransferase [Candidatus Bipolaricaulota bacterium]|nr:RNA 2'-phosphotransferase [Candidatus Bipolaricaulota bacterium]